MPEKMYRDKEVQYSFQPWETTMLLRKDLIYFVEPTVIPLLLTMICPPEKIEQFEDLLDRHGFAIYSINKG
jgi:hypothetical protein